MDSTEKPAAKQRIMFLYLHTGGGHISASKALARDIESRYNPDEVEVHIVNGAGPTKNANRKFIEDGYTMASSAFPFLWPPQYALGSYRPVMSYVTNHMRLTCTEVIERYIVEHDINKVVVLHFMLLAPLRSALSRLGKSGMPIITIVLDPFTVHNMWTFRQYGPMIVFSEEAKRRVLRRLRKFALKGSPAALPEPPVTIMPPILDRRFATSLSAEENVRNREALGFSNDKPLILLAGGGDGLPQGELYLTALGIAKLDIQVAMVCGKNRAQYDICTVLAKLNTKKNIKVYGFVSNMYELMNMADIAIAKGGPATVFEILALHKPLIIMKHLYGQEKGNVDFVVRHGLGWYENTPQRLVRRLTQLLEKPETFNEVRKRLVKLQIGIGTQDISDHIMNLK
jgi:processive 1,2-diacylglycerol beta-glucosyltransferase/1,2-diacylglycerol 3-beta-galactosyltransferase